MLQAISYRDPHGFVSMRGKLVYRYVKASYAETYDHLMESGLYAELVDKELLIPHRETSSINNDQNDYYRILNSETIEPVSYPYEWSAGQWKEMTRCFLEINSICIAYGMILKDATPFNFTFYRNKCIFIDTLSFDFYKEGDPWGAYRQFCEMILGPAALIHFKGTAWSKMMQSFINGWSLSFISVQLPSRTWFKVSLLVHIHWHAKYEGKDGDKKQRGALSSEKLLMLWRMIDRTIQKWDLPAEKNIWGSYYTDTILSKQYLEEKTIVISEILERIKPQTVIDLGANAGKFSLLAGRYADKVIAVEPDHSCIEHMRSEIRSGTIKNIETILADITQPSPAIGWYNKERPALLDRLHGDSLLALALIHHLCIGSNVPLSFIANLFSDITSDYAIVEFVPKSDQKVKEMMINREDIFDSYTEENFDHSFSRYFDMEQKYSLQSSDRTIYVWRKKQAIC